MNYKGKILDEQSSWQEMTSAGNIEGGGTSEQFHTGDWRSVRPVIDMDKCKQCLFCVPVCPDNAIPVLDIKRGEFLYDYCKGCGICADVCPFGAIRMEKER